MKFRNKKQESPIPPEKTIQEKADEQIAEYDLMYQQYKTLWNTAKLIVDKYADWFQNISLTSKEITLSLKANDKIPALFCECEKAGLTAILTSGDRGWYTEGRYNLSPPRDSIHISLKQ